MEWVLFVSMWAQQSPAEALKKFHEAVEKKDADAAEQVWAGTPEELKEILEEPKEVVDALKKAPAIAAPAEDVERFEVEWKYVSADGLCEGQAEFGKKGKDWKLEDFDCDLRKDGKTKGTIGAAKSTPSDVVKAFVEAIQKKEYGSVAALWVEKERKGLTAEMVEKEVKRENARYVGWLEGLKKLCILGATDDSLTELEFGVEFSTADGKVGVGVNLIKENGDWRLKDLDVDVKKDK